jgi:hypothetical protein
MWRKQRFCSIYVVLPLIVYKNFAGIVQFSQEPQKVRRNRA